jgi:hypothetical protein
MRSEPGFPGARPRPAPRTAWVVSRRSRS